MIEKRKTAKGTAQKIGNPPKHLQVGKSTAGNPKAGEGAPKPQHLPCEARSRPSLRDGTWEEPNDFEATSNGD